MNLAEAIDQLGLGVGRLVVRDGVADLQFEDGTRLSDLRDALQAAYLASRYTFAVELVTRYRLDFILCLRCANAQALADIAPGDPFSGRLCSDCYWHGRTLNEVHAQQHQLRDR